MATNKTSDREHRKKKKELRKGLLSFLKKLREACKSFDSWGGWEDFVKPLQDLIEKYEDELPQAYSQALKEAIKLKDASKEGIEDACKLLDQEIEKTILILPVSASVGAILIGVFIAAAVVTAVAVTVLETTTKEVVIANNNCGDILLYPGGVNLPGLHLPEKIANVAQETARVPVFLTVAVDVEPGGMTFKLLSDQHFSFSRQVSSATFNTVNILGSPTTLNFGSRPQNELTFTCQ